MGGRRDLRHLLDQFQVFRVTTKFIVADQRPKGCTAEGAELFFVDFLEQRALVEFDGSSSLCSRSFFRGIEHLDLEAGAGFALSTRYWSPRQSLQLLELLVVHHLIQLLSEQAIDIGNSGVDRCLQVLRDEQFPFITSSTRVVICCLDLSRCSSSRPIRVSLMI